MLEKTDRVWTVGSCFAENIHKSLTKHGVASASFGLTERANSPPAIRALFERLEAPGDDNSAMAEARAFVAAAKCAVVTVGVGAAQFLPDGGFAFHATDDVGTWRPLEVEEAERDLRLTMECLWRMNPQAFVVLTLSPVPLNRASWNSSGVVADCVSKSTLRVAIDRYLRSNPGAVVYWPAFEIVRWLGAHIPGHFGGDDALQRHVTLSVVDTVTELFIESYVK